MDAEGRTFRLSDLRGRPVLVNFWGTWCPSCVRELPAIQRALDDHADEGLAVVLVNVQEDSKSALRYLADLGVRARAVFDPQGEIARRWGVVGFPASFFIDRGGILRKAWYGEMSVSQVEEFTHTILGYAVTPSSQAPVGLDVLLDPEGPGTMYLWSVVIRCDASYCARDLVRALVPTPGVRDVRPVPQEGGRVAVFIRFDPARTSPESIVTVFRGALRFRPDPVFGSDVTVRYLRPIASGPPPLSRPAGSPLP